MGEVVLNWRFRGEGADGGVGGRIMWSKYDT